ncbi:MAG TPA: bifunctional 5,10-methylenetetrahydrofolate dehydrogenase/5,10-methenyltetrahydrofolate cyclohydrolase [Streptosporangiaceae bacterium]|nr:bifunctional 5,10-methylenetetrahydrofolate dehydrogenase/5,10-methenyltetrahydrofolate cyclohydrolase [Streptosporangiaceae bacterium]
MSPPTTGTWPGRQPGRLIDGRAVAARITEETASEVVALRDRGVVPTLAIVVPNDDPGTAWYVRSLRRQADRTGVEVDVHQELSATATVATLARLSADPAVHGIICQTPLPAGLTTIEVGATIALAKDVDGANPASLGGVAAGEPGAFAPATAAAVMEILASEGIDLAGRPAVVVGRSTVVGRPAALLLIAASATVTVAHSRTRDLAAVCREAEILVVAAGRPQLIGAGHVAPGAVVIDVGTNPAADGGLTGDVDTAAVQAIAAAVTPVPGGVGPVTTAQLLRQTVWAAEVALFG